MQMGSTRSRHALRREDVTLSGRLIHALRNAVLNGTFAPGQRLKERDLCAMFDVSRPLIREAIQKLESEDLVTVVPHRGPTVTRIDRKDARDLYRVRAALEGLMVEEFTVNAAEADRSALFALSEQLSSMTEADTADKLVEIKNAFYGCLQRGAHNHTLAQMFIQLNNRIVQLRRFSLKQPGRLPVTIAEIHAIVDAIRAGDATAARRLAERHVASAAAVADQRFAEIELTASHEPKGANGGRGNL